MDGMKDFIFSIFQSITIIMNLIRSVTC